MSGSWHRNDVQAVSKDKMRGGFWRRGSGKRKKYKRGNLKWKKRKTGWALVTLVDRAERPALVLPVFDFFLPQGILSMYEKRKYMFHDRALMACSPI